MSATSPVMTAVQYIAPCHEYIVIEYGRKLSKKIDGYAYSDYSPYTLSFLTNNVNNDNIHR